MSSSSLDDPVYNEIPTIAADKAAGSCGFCGHGDGWLGEQGDETTQSLHGALRHKYQRYDDTNLRALFLSTKLRLELDGIRWVGWEANDGEEREAVRKYLDDTAVHMEKLRAESDLRDMQEEQFRRYGHPPRDGWRI
jgi:hypothetical protein